MTIEAIVDQVVTFTDNSTGLDATATYAWDFGDGTISTLKSPTHAYSVKGIKNIVHTVKNSCNATAISCTGNTVNVISKVCGWIKGLGGRSALTTMHVFTITDAVLGFVTLSFTPTVQDVFGVTDSVLGFIPSGDVGECA